MKKLIINIGISGSGKSFSTNSEEGAYVVSSDDLRIELFGSLKEGNTKEANEKVWKHINDTLFDHFEDHDIVILDATNLNLRRRKVYYDKFKRLFKDGIVEARIFFATPFTSMVNQYWRSTDEFVPLSVVERQFMTLQIPILGSDCDEITPLGENWFENTNIPALVRSFTFTNTEEALQDFIHSSTIPELLSMIYTKHDSPYHLETVDCHIKWVIENTIKYLKTLDDIGDEAFLLAAIFHDLGKGYVKNRGDNRGGQFKYHDLLSAQFAANLTLFNNLKYYNAAILARFHMDAHQFKELSPKAIARKQRRYNLTDDQLGELRCFAKIDSASRVPEFEKSELHSVIKSITETLESSFQGTHTKMIAPITFTYSFENGRIKVTGFNGVWCTMHLKEEFTSFEEFENKYLKNYNI